LLTTSIVLGDGQESCGFRGWIGTGTGTGTVIILLVRIYVTGESLANMMSLDKFTLCKNLLPEKICSKELLCKIFFVLLSCCVAVGLDKNLFSFPPYQISCRTAIFQPSVLLVVKFIWR
jgi:hypothetical protein